MKNITSSEFNEAVKSNKNVIIQFSADWCGPCKQLTPILDNFANEREDVTVFKVDVGEETGLATQYKVKSIPKLVFFKDGIQKNEKTGLINAEKLTEIIS
jgi:thioredoxin 1